MKRRHVKGCWLGNDDGIACMNCLNIIHRGAAWYAFKARWSWYWLQTKRWFKRISYGH